MFGLLQAKERQFWTLYLWQEREEDLHDWLDWTAVHYRCVVKTAPEPGGEEQLKTAGSITL